MLNQVQLIGFVGQNPTIHTTEAGPKVANISLATSSWWLDKTTGERKEKTEWHRVVIFNGLAEVAEKFIHKGRKVFIQGALRTRKYNKDGVDHYSTEIVVSTGGKLVLLDKKEGGEGQAAGQVEEDEGVPF